MPANWQRGNTPKPGDPITSRSFGNISDAATGARQAPTTDVFGIQAAGGFIAFPLPVKRSITVIAWPFKVYNTTTGSTGQVQINGGDGFVGSLNGFVATVGGNPIDTQFGSPLAYPQLAVTGNGVIYGYATPTTAGTASPIASLPIYYAGTIPSVDTANPATYYPFLLATITAYATDGSGNVSFTVNNATNYGFTTLIYCNGAISVF